MERPVGGPGAGPRHPGYGDERIDPLPAFRRCAEDVQAVADLHLLQLAKVGVEAAQRRAGILPVEAEIAVEAMALRRRDDLALEIGPPSRVDAGGEVILVDERLELGEGPMDLGPGHRRRQVVDDDRGGAALGLGALPRVVDDERVDERRRPERHLGPARGRQPERLAGQPFEVAVLAEMDDGVGGERSAEPGVEGQIMVRRDEIRIVVGGLRVDVVAPRRLDADDGIAEPMGGDAEGAVREERIVLRQAPTHGQGVADRGRQAGEERRIAFERQGDLRRGSCGQPAERVGPARQQGRHQPGARRRETGEIVAGFAHRHRQAHRALRRVEADPVGDAAVAVRIVGEDERDTSLPDRPAREAHPGRGLPGNEGDPVGDRPIGGRAARRRPIEALRLERHRARQDATVHFGQHDIHDEVVRQEAAGAFPPRLFAGAGEHHLQHRAAGPVEHGRPAFRTDRRHREGGGVENERRGKAPEKAVEEGLAVAVLEAGDEHRQAGDPLGGEGPGQGIDRRGRAALQDRPVEDDGRHRQAGAHPRRDRVQ